MAEPPPPMAEAVERLAGAAQAWLDGPVAHLRAAADRCGRADHDADTAAADAAGFGVRVARWWWEATNAAIDAVAWLAMPPGSAQLFDLAIPPVAVTSTVQLVSRTWTWQLGDEPVGVSLDVVPPLVLQPGTQHVRLRANPRLLHCEPSWDVVLEVLPVGTAPGQGTLVTGAVDATTLVLGPP